MIRRWSRVFVGCSALLGVGAVWACGSDAPAAPSSCEGVELIVAASTNYLSSLICGAPPCAPHAGPDLGRDPLLASSNGRLFYLGRPNDLVFELDATCGTPLHRFSVAQAGVDLANPHDVAAAPDGSVFVVLYGVPRIVVHKDGQPDETIDISAYDGDGNPQADAIRIVAVGGVWKAFVTLEKLDDLDLRPGHYLESKQASTMLRIDVATRKVEAAIELAGRNPFNAMAELAGGLFLAEPGNFNKADEALAGIERFDIATSTSRLLVTETQLEGSVSEVAVTDGCGAAIVAGPQDTVNPTSLVTFDPVTGQVFAAPLYGPTEGYDLQGLAWRGDSLYLGDRRRAGVGYQVHVFDRDPGTCNLHAVTRNIDIPQAPVMFRAAR